MEALAKSSPRDLAAAASAHLAIWSRMLGNREAASRLSAQASRGITQANALQIFVSRFLTQPSADAGEWEQRAARSFPTPAARLIRDLTLSYALLFDKEFAAASRVLTQLELSGASSPDVDISLLLAWSQVETGQVEEAAPRLRWNPAPPASSGGVYISLYFPRIYYLRAVAAEKEGRAEEAKDLYRLFLQLSGPDPLMWGEEQKAQAAVQ